MDIKAEIDAKRVLVVLPTYNNEATIEGVITEILSYSDNLLVVNDGATDSTSTILERLGVEHISYSPNRGKGYAIRAAFKYAREHDFDYVLTIDSDGQHYPSEIERFVKQIDETPDALVIGSRNLKADNMPSKNTFANKFSNFWFFVETAQKLDDTQSGYRLYPIKAMKGVRFLCNRYEFEVEVIVRAAWRGIRVLNMPIKVYYPPEGERISHFKPFKDFTRISILNTFLVIIALLYYYPLKFLRYFTIKNLKEFVRQNITHNQESNLRISSAIGLGVFFGIFPIWGYQMIVAAFVAHLLKLNKLIVLVSSNISIPPMIPFILYGSFCTGALLMGQSLSMDILSVSFEQISSNLLLYLLGAVVLAFGAGGVAFLVSYILFSIFRRRR